MYTSFLTLGFIMLLAVMSPGPDFALVTKNAILHSRRAGIWTTLGIVCANMVHMTYCILGIALLISKSLFVFNTIKYLGAAYLIYIGVQSFLSKPSTIKNPQHTGRTTVLSDFAAFRQGFLCNILNPKATLFFLALFTVIIKPDTPRTHAVLVALEVLLISFTWFCSLTLFLSHPRIVRLLNKLEKYISKILGVCLVGFGVMLILA